MARLVCLRRFFERIRCVSQQQRQLHRKSLEINMLLQLRDCDQQHSDPKVCTRFAEESAHSNLLVSEKRPYKEEPSSAEDKSEREGHLRIVP